MRRTLSSFEFWALLQTITRCARPRKPFRKWPTQNIDLELSQKLTKKSMNGVSHRRIRPRKPSKKSEAAKKTKVTAAVGGLSSLKPCPTLVLSLCATMGHSFTGRLQSWWTKSQVGALNVRSILFFRNSKLNAQSLTLWNNSWMCYWINQFRVQMKCKIWLFLRKKRLNWQETLIISNWNTNESWERIMICYSWWYDFCVFCGIGAISCLKLRVAAECEVEAVGVDGVDVWGMVTVVVVLHRISPVIFQEVFALDSSKQIRSSSTVFWDFSSIRTLLWIGRDKLLLRRWRMTWMLFSGLWWVTLELFVIPSGCWWMGVCARSSTTTAFLA